MDRKLKQSINRKRLIKESFSDVEDKAKEVQNPVYADAIRGIKRADKAREEYRKLPKAEVREEKPKVKGNPNLKKMYLSESLFEDYDEPSDYLITLYDDGESTIDGADQYTIDANYFELEEMSDEELAEQGIAGFARLMLDDEGTLVFDDESYARQGFEAKLQEVIDSYLGKEDNFDESLNESSNTNYDIEYYLNTASADRRPTTTQDVDEDYVYTTIEASNDLEALEKTFFIQAEEDYYDGVFDDYGIEDTVEGFKDYFNNVDISGGEIIICKVSQGSRVIYDSGMDKEYFLNDDYDDDYDESFNLREEYEDTPTSLEDEIIRIVGDEYESGGPLYKNINMLKDDLINSFDYDFSKVDFNSLWTLYIELHDMGPEGFYAEYNDKYDFSDDFKGQYGLDDFDE